jgi:hypothetical protein
VLFTSCSSPVADSQKHNISSYFQHAACCMAVELLLTTIVLSTHCTRPGLLTAGTFEQQILVVPPGQVLAPWTNAAHMVWGVTPSKTLADH